MGRYDLIAFGIVFAIPMIMAAIWILSHRDLVKNTPQLFYLSNPLKLLLPILFFLLFTISVIILIKYTVRPLLYFLIITGLYLLILIQILLIPTSLIIILMQIFFLMLNIACGVIFKYPLYFGGSDTLVHLYFCDITFKTGHVISSNLDIGYSKFPLFHILIAISCHILGLSIKETFFLLSPILFVSSLFPIYYITQLISKNHTLALLSCLTYSSFPTVIYYGAYVSPRVLAYIELLFLIYLLLRSPNATNFIPYKFLCILTLSGIILYHSVSIMQFLVFIIPIMLVERLLKTKISISGTFFTLMVTMFLGYWFFVAISLTSNLIIQLLDTLHFDEALILPMKINTYFLYDNFPYSVFLFFGLIGIYWSIRKRGHMSVFGFISMPLILLFIPKLKTVWLIQRQFGLYRYELFTTPFMAIIFGIGIYILFGYINSGIFSKIRIIKIFLLFSLLSASTFTSIYNSSNASDTLTNVPSRYFSDGELLGFKFVEEKAPSNSTIYGDYSSERYFVGRKYFPGIETYNLNSYKVRPLPSLNDINKANGYFIYRYEEFRKGPLLFRTLAGYIEVKYDSVEREKIEIALMHQNKIYGSGIYELFHNPCCI